MVLLRRRRRSPVTNVTHPTGRVTFTAQRPPRRVAEPPPEDAERAVGACSAHPTGTEVPHRPLEQPADAAPAPPADHRDAPPPRPGDRVPTKVTIHQEQVDHPAPRLELTPSEAWHLAQEGRRPTR